ncbi:MAG: DNA methyltransferase [Hyphomicrobiaceae bacterium]
MRGQVQCIYFDPPYGIKFNSNWQVSTANTSVVDGKQADISREPEQIKAFRDTWKDGIHSYLTYLRDRLAVARDLLHESGSIFLQIGGENVHRVRSVLDEVLGADNFISLIALTNTSFATSGYLPGVADYTIWFSKDRATTKYRHYLERRCPAAAALVIITLSSFQFDAKVSGRPRRGGPKECTPGPAGRRRSAACQASL